MLSWFSFLLPNLWHTTNHREFLLNIIYTTTSHTCFIRWLTFYHWGKYTKMSSRNFSWFFFFFFASDSNLFRVAAIFWQSIIEQNRPFLQISMLPYELVSNFSLWPDFWLTLEFSNLGIWVAKVTVYKYMY